MRSPLVGLLDSGCHANLGARERVSANVIVVGSANVDLVMRVPRLPAPGETVIGGAFSRAPGGKGANQAAAAATLGARTRFVGKVGEDDLGAWTRSDLERTGVDCTALGTSPSPTGVAQIWVDDAGENAITVASGANADVDGAFVADALAAIGAAEAVVLANLEIPDEAVRAAADGAAERGWPFVLNPAPARAVDPAVLRRVSVLTPNRAEAAALAPSIDALLDAGPDTVVVTLGDAGAEVHRAGRDVHRQRAFAVEVRDTTGAGDAFSATLAWAIAEGRALGEAVRLAAGAGALATRAVGARSSLATREELAAFVTACPPRGRPFVQGHP
jgi:ribokinase